MSQKKSNGDTTIDEIHRTRQQMADKFGGDIAAILEDARKRQAASGRPVWQGPSNKRCRRPADRAICQWMARLPPPRDPGRSSRRRLRPVRLLAVLVAQRSGPVLALATLGQYLGEEGRFRDRAGRRIVRSSPVIGPHAISRNDRRMQPCGTAHVAISSGLSAVLRSIALATGSCARRRFLASGWASDNRRGPESPGCACRCRSSSTTRRAW